MKEVVQGVVPRVSDDKINNRLDKSVRNINEVITFEIIPVVYTRKKKETTIYNMISNYDTYTWLVQDRVMLLSVNSTKHVS